MKKIYILKVWENTRNGGKHLMHQTYSTNFKDIQKRIFKETKPEHEEKAIYEITIHKIEFNGNKI